MNSSCPDADFTFLANGLQVREREIQSDSITMQFLPYRAIQSVRYTYSRNDREGRISIWISSQGTPGAGGLSFRWRFPGSSNNAEDTYNELISRLAAN